MTDTSIPFLAPGCFGSALMFNGSDMVCRACTLSQQCEPKHLLALAMMRERHGIIAPLSRSKPQMRVEAIEKTEDPGVMTLPKKVRELLERIDRGSFNIVEKMKQGLNPFAGRPEMKFMLVACHMILNPKAMVTQGLLEAGMIKALGHSEGTASAHARMAIQALVHVGAVAIENGIIKVRN